MYSSIAFDPGLRWPQEKHQNLQLFKSLNLAMGTASGAFTALFGIDFPKAIYKGNVLGYQFRAANSFRAGGLHVLFVWAKRNFIFVDQTGWTSNFVCVFFMHW